MFVGHFAVGLVGKRVAPKVSLGTLVLASMLADLLWLVFNLAGIEHLRLKPGVKGPEAFDLYDIAISHSLLMDAIWAALFAAAYFWRRHDRRGAWVLFAVVLSHWLLDFVAHPPDMPLAPGVHRYYGLGLWNSLPATLIVEGGFWLFAIIFYARATSPKKRAGGRYAFWIVVALLTLAWINNVRHGPPPPTPINTIVSLIFFSVVVAWAYWMNRLRPLKFDSTDSKALQSRAMQGNA